MRRWRSLPDRSRASSSSRADNETAGEVRGGGKAGCAVGGLGVGVGGSRVAVHAQQGQARAARAHAHAAAGRGRGGGRRGTEARGVEPGLVDVLHALPVHVPPFPPARARTVRPDLVLAHRARFVCHVAPKAKHKSSQAGCLRATPPEGRGNPPLCGALQCGNLTHASAPRAL